MLKSLKERLAEVFGIRMEVPVEGHQFVVTHLKAFKGHRTVVAGWRDGTPAEIALSLALDGTAKSGEYIRCAGQRWRAWNGAITPVDPAVRVRGGDRRRDRERRPNPCQLSLWGA